MAIKLATTFPTMDLGTDAGTLRTWAQGVEEIGFDEIYIPEHVVGVDTTRRPDWRPLNPNTLKSGPPLYGHTTPFLEPCVALGFLAAVTHTIGLMSGILVLPQRQTALVAKQIAIADILSQGRVRLGIGSGWNDAEFAALGSEFKGRGNRMDEQIGVLRRLWTEESVSFSGSYHEFDAVGICPLPQQRPVPIIVGGDSRRAMLRAAHVGDGWFVTGTVDQVSDRARSYWGEVDRAGRDRSDQSLIGTLYLGTRDPHELADEIRTWASLGATHLNIRTSSYPVQWRDGKAIKRPDVSDHVDALWAIAKVATVLGLSEAGNRQLMC